jgi:methyltransferase-like protein/SAM-dependent methyltransferase
MTNPYDEVLYEGLPFEQTHPDRLATIARLFGMTPAPIDACRVLELGCGDGGNLIPLACTLPGSVFVGLDAGGVGIAKGREVVRRLGLSNLELLHLDLLQADSLGRFDYIVAHGVYSWTPPAVQERILAICRESLNPQGVAYISYSVYPGAHVSRMIAEMMQDHARRFTDPRQKIEQARAMIAFLAGARKDADPYAMLLQQRLESLWARNPTSIFHDELSEYQEPVYFREFAARAARHGLQYLGEADFHEMQDCTQPRETVAQLHLLAPDLIEREQHLDYLKCRRFRQTLLCHADVALDRRLRSEQMREFRIHTARPRDPDKPTPSITNHPLAVAANDVLLDAWPTALTFAELLAAVRERGGASDDDELLLQDLVLAHVAVGLFELQTSPARYARSAGEFPRASRLARLQAEAGAIVTNLMHRPVHIEDDRSRALLQAMDGTRDRAALLETLRSTCGPEDGEATPADLERGIEQLARLALLEA